MIELDLCLRVLGHALDYQVGICHSDRQVELKLERVIRALHRIERRLLIERLIAIGNARAPLARTVRHTLNSCDVFLAHMVDLGLRTANGALAPQPNSDIKAAIRCLERNLTSQYAASGHANVLVAHGGLLLLLATLQ